MRWSNLSRCRMANRQYLKRVWRVPKTRGATTYLAALVLKALRKHGWPADIESVPLDWGDGFQVVHYKEGRQFGGPFSEAVSIAVRITARTYKLDLEETSGLVMFLREYEVTAGGFFKEIKK